MLRKSEVIKLLNHEDELVSDAIYTYICRFHLFDDNDINKEFIKFIKNNDINYAEMKSVKLNNDIIQTLMDLKKEEKNPIKKAGIESVLINNYEFVRDIDNLEESFVGEEEKLFLKKLKHFAKKDLEDLMGLFGNCVSNEIAAKDELLVSDIIRREAIGYAIIMKENGYDALLESLRVVSMSFDELLKDEETTDEIMVDFMMKFYISLFCRLDNDNTKEMVLDYFISNDDPDDSYMECLSYFSRLNPKSFFDFHKKSVKKISRKDIQGFFYEVCSFINLEDVDDFLKEEYHKAISDEQKEFILSSLMERFYFDYIDEALLFIKNIGIER